MCESHVTVLVMGNAVTWADNPYSDPNCQGDSFFVSSKQTYQLFELTGPYGRFYQQLSSYKCWLPDNLAVAI